MHRSRPTLEVVSFYGADGCGKTTIARSFAEKMNEHGSEYCVLGGSSYKEWLTPTVAREVLGSDHRLDKTNDTFETKTLLYEDIAIACYGLAAKLRDDGKNIAIDSDPYLKRIIWSTIENSDCDTRDRYVERFSTRMVEHLGDDLNLTNVVGINIDDNHVDDTQLLDRIVKRGGVSEFDPTEIEEMRALTAAVKKVWGEMRQMPFLTDTRFMAISNPECTSEQEIATQAETVVNQVVERIHPGLIE
jgi:hypothetical protein